MACRAVARPRLVAREGIAPPTSLCKRDMILFHHRAEIGCGRRIRTIDFAFKERRVACYSIPHWDWPAIRSSEPERVQPSVAGRLWRASFTLTQPPWLSAKDGGAGGSCNL